MTKPGNIKELAPDIQEYIKHLENKVQFLEEKILDDEEDGLKNFLIVINRKMNQIARSIDSYNFKIDNTEDKAFERFWAASTQFKKLADDMKAVKQSFGLTDDDLKDKKLSPQEKLALERGRSNGRDKHTTV